MTVIDRLRRYCEMNGTTLRDMMPESRRLVRRVIKDENLIDEALMLSGPYDPGHPPQGKKAGERARHSLARALERLPPDAEKHVFSGALIEALERAHGDPVLADAWLPDILRERVARPFRGSTRKRDRLLVGRKLADIADRAGIRIESAPSSPFVQFIESLGLPHDARQLARDILGEIGHPMPEDTQAP